MEKHEELEYTLSKKLLISLFIYYMLILIGGCFCTIHIGYSLAEQVSQPLLLRKTFYISLSVSSMLCSVRYIKRLYKACITERIDTQANTLKRIGNFVYFVSRPFFACVFSVVAIFCVLSGMFIVAGSLDYILNEKFLYLCVIISAIVGFSVGKVLDKFEEISIERIKSLKS